MAVRRARYTAEHDQPAIEVAIAVEGEIRELVRRNVATKPGRQLENQCELVASNINSVLQRVTATSVQEIDQLITELQAMSDILNIEAERVQREIVQYSTFTQGALQSTKIIAESLQQWRRFPTT